MWLSVESSTWLSVEPSTWLSVDPPWGESDPCILGLYESIVKAQSGFGLGTGVGLVCRPNQDKFCVQVCD